MTTKTPKRMRINMVRELLEFLYARHEMPTERKDLRRVFAYNGGTIHLMLEKLKDSRVINVDRKHVHTYSGTTITITQHGMDVLFAMRRLAELSGDIFW